MKEINHIVIAIGVLAMVAVSIGCSKSDLPVPNDITYKIAVTSEVNKDKYDQDIFTLNPDGTEWVDITNSPGADADPAWSPDGKKIAFMSVRSGNGEIWIMDAGGSNAFNLTNDSSRWDLEPEWSPFGDKLVYISNSGNEGTAEIFIINADGTNRKQLTNNDYNDAYPVFSPNGKMIVFHSDKGFIQIGECYDPQRGTVTKYANEIYLMDTGGNNVVRLTNLGMGTRGISWSPDGTQLVYTSNEGCDPSEIYTMDVGDLTNMDLSILKDKSSEELENMEELGYLKITQLTDNPTGPDTNPSFSPDGTKIVWQSIRDGVTGGNELFIMNAVDGSDVTRITFTNAQEKDPDWMR